MKIALIHASDDGHGAERCVMDLHRSLQAHGHGSVLYVGSASTREPNVVRIPRPRVFPGIMRAPHWLDSCWGLQALYSPGLRQLATTLDPGTTVVHIHTLWGGERYGDLGAVRLFARRFPVVVTLHEQWLTTGHCACPFECQRWQRGCGQCPDLSRTPGIPHDVTRLNWWRKRQAFRAQGIQIVTVSNWLLGVVQRSPILRHHPAQVVYNGIDDRVFCPTEQRRRLRDEMGLPTGATVALLTGQTVEGVREGRAQHGVAALNRLGETSGLFALVVGASSTQVAERLAVPCRTMPFQTTPDAMARCYQAADFTLVTSEYETFGRVAAESQLCETPAIVFSTGGLPEVVADQSTGYVVPTGDTEMLADAIRRFMSLSDEDRHAMGRRGRLRARSLFGNAVIARQYLDLYQRLSAEGRRR